MTFFCATHILQVIGRQSIVYKSITTVCSDATALNDLIEIINKNKTRLPVTRWVKSSLNFELLVPKWGN